MAAISTRSFLLNNTALTSTPKAFERAHNVVTAQREADHRRALRSMDDLLDEVRRFSLASTDMKKLEAFV